MAPASSALVRISLTCLGLGLVACSTAADPTPAADLRAGSLGILQVERTVSVDEPGVPAPRAVLGAAFARYRGVDGEVVARLLGGGDGAEERCFSEAVGVSEHASNDAEVELLDVGAIGVRAGETEARLLPRTFPELASLVAGVFYAGDSDLGAPRAELDEYAFRAEGSPEVAAFEVSVPAPAEPSDVRIDGLVAEAVPVLARASDAVVTWEAGDPRDFVEIELRAGVDGMRCVARDDGAFRITAAVVDELEPDLRARLVFRRVRVQSFDATGVDVAYVRVAVARTFDAVLR